MRPICIPSGRDVASLSFLPVHLTTAAAFVVLAWAVCGMLVATRPTRIAFLSGLTDGRRKLCADAFATAWIIATLLGVCGLNQLLLVATSFGLPPEVNASASVLRASAVVVCAVQAWRIWRRLAIR